MAEQGECFPCLLKYLTASFSYIPDIFLWAFSQLKEVRVIAILHLEYVILLTLSRLSAFYLLKIVKPSIILISLIAEDFRYSFFRLTNILHHKTISSMIQKLEISETFVSFCSKLKVFKNTSSFSDSLGFKIRLVEYSFGHICL